MAKNSTLDALGAPAWFDEPVVNVVLAANGYPGKYNKGTPINDLDYANETDGVVIFHAGTKRDGAQLQAAGGRVLSVTAQAPTLKEAVEKAYDVIDTKIDWEDGFCRRYCVSGAVEL
ncbi:phosphoribosylglycinamide synthetase C domain-containing protein [Litorimonas haliclonae]|uniref:phosphoribosylglycinamide synthetase C domain-containing protein n=1 Tax=Litorimonas haliclonae TaxID=2081977 RepID=UPI0039EE08B1